MSAKPNLHAVILAGGRGTRFWPRSRRKNPKQLLPFIGAQSLLQETVERIEPLVPAERVWVFTNTTLRNKIRKQLPDVPAEQIVAEPEGRNTAPCIALAAKLLAERDPEAVMAVLPSDHIITDHKTYLQTIERAARAALRRKLVVIGIEPRWPEVGYGYIEFPKGTKPGGAKAVEVVRFCEKPKLAAAKRFVKAGNYFWNSGQFVWNVATIQAAFERYMPATAEALQSLAPLDSRKFRASLRKTYPLCEATSIDYGVLEKADNIVGFPAKNFGWNDVGSWEALYAMASKDPEGNVANTPVELLGAEGNFVDAPGKLVALVGVKDLVVVDTPDALLICPREDSQKVSALVKALEKAGLDGVL